MVGRGGPSNWFGHCIDVELAIEGEKCSAGGVRSTLHKMAYPSLLKWSGSGLSSFGYLKTMPVDLLKIDGMFVKDILDDPIDLAMVRSINEIGHVMGKQTIAEFVENEQVRGRLREMGVDFAQGYGVGRPVLFAAQSPLRRAS